MATLFSQHREPRKRPRGRSLWPRRFHVQRLIVRQAISLMKLYEQLAEWWPVFSDAEEYRREVAHFSRVLRQATRPAPSTVLERGSGGGSSALHLKRRFAMTLVDLSPRMLRVSRRANPDCEHVRGDIRSIRLGRTFDAVYTHDAICHMTTEA